MPGSVLSLSAGGQDNLVWVGTDRGALVSFKVDTVGRLTKCHRFNDALIQDLLSATNSSFLKVRTYIGIYAITH